MTNEQMDVRYKMFGIWVVRRLIEGKIDHIDQVTDAAMDLRLIDVNGNDDLIAVQPEDEGWGDD